MDIYCVTNHFLGSVKSLFLGHNVMVLPPDYSNLDIPLLVFTGGEDIEPSRYNSNRKVTTWFNKERDEWEFKVFKDYRRGRIKVKKVLGICRGHQLVNVGLGGSLTYDIAEKYGNSHPSSHEIAWLRPNLFSSIINRINSMHHQCIEYIGESLPYSILGIEPRTSVIEAIMWSNRILGVQFHPEMFPSGEEKRKMGKAIIDWVGETKISPSEKSSGLFSTAYSFATSAPVELSSEDSPEEIEDEELEDEESEQEDE
jgi:gamma-glutamyl-gamma-aminobutyrate hydrolase PuuD